MPASAPAPHILIVDDDPGLRTLLGDALEAERFRVTAVASASAARAALEREALKLTQHPEIKKTFAEVREHWLKLAEPSPDQRRIFERFARGAIAGRRSSSDGAGLGLSLVDLRDDRAGHAGAGSDSVGTDRDDRSRDPGIVARGGFSGPVHDACGIHAGHAS